NVVPDLEVELLPPEGQAHGRRVADSHIFFQFVAVQLVEIARKPEKAVFGLNDHRLELAMNLEAEPLSLSFGSGYRQGGRSQAFPDTSRPSDHRNKPGVFDHMVVSDQLNIGRRNV